MIDLHYRVTSDNAGKGSIDLDYVHTEGVLHRMGVTFLKRNDARTWILFRGQLKRIFPNRYDCFAGFPVMLGGTCGQATVWGLSEETGLFAPVDAVGRSALHDAAENQILAALSVASSK